jgi:hypothetical protein
VWLPAPGNDRPLNARQKLLRFGQGQTQVRDLAKTFRPADLYQICAQAAGIIADRNQPQYPSHPRSPSRLSTRPIVPLVSSSPHMWTAPSSQDVLQRFDQIACVHMSGLLLRSHMNAGQDGFRDESSKHSRDLIEGHGGIRSVPRRGSIDHTICSLSCKFWHRLSTVAV